MAIKWAPASAEELARRGLAPVRARDERGAFVPDDPSTPDVNEAWEKPKAKPRSKRKTKE